MAAKLRDEYPLGLEIGGDRTFDGLGHVTTDTALLFGQTGTVDFAARADTGTSDTANT